MKGDRFYRMGCFFAILSLLVLFGCASTPSTRFYVLSPMPGPEKGEGEPCVSILVGPVKIPEYLDRSGIVTTLSPNEMNVGEFHKWAESVEFNFPRVLAENLSSLLCTKAVVIPPVRGAVPVDYRVYVEVVRMDGKLGGEAVLDASWTLLGSLDKKEVLVRKRGSYKEPTNGQGYEAYVSAQSRNVGALSRDIAKAIETGAQKPRQ
jgi:uncharacterized lipoprotein YmbA